MTTNSYPAVGAGGLTEAQWAGMYAGEDGIVEDYSATGSAAMTLDNTANTATLSVGLIRINGYTLDITVAHALSLPAVSSGTKTYLIAAQYDPALNVAESGNRSSLGPCRLVVADTTLDTSGGKQYTLLYSVTRAASTALTASTIVDYRRWLGPVLTAPDLPADTPGANQFPRGTMLIRTRQGAVDDKVDILTRIPNSGATALVWSSLMVPTSQAFPLAGGGILLAYSATSPPTMHRYPGSMIALRGTIKRNSGKLGTGANVTLGTLPAGWRPGQSMRFLVFASGSTSINGSVVVYVTGEVVLATGGDQANIDYIHFDGIVFRAEN